MPRRRSQLARSRSVPSEFRYLSSQRMGEAMEKTSQLLVGSIPLRSALDVFTTASDYFSDNLASMPDGEFGDRIWWHNYLARYVYHGHPDIKTIKRPAPIDGFPNWKPSDLSDMWLFEVQDGVASRPSSRRSCCAGYGTLVRLLLARS
jgi:hypothetical protein